MQNPENYSLPKSLAEARELGHNLYFTGVACKHGHTTYRYVKDRACSTCVKNKVKRLSTTGGGNARRWANRTPEQLAKIYANRKNYYAKTKEARLEEKKRSYIQLKQNSTWVEQRKRKINEHRKLFGRALEKSNPEVKKRYKQTPQGKVNSAVNGAKRRAAKMQRTPAWLTEDDYWMIEQAYELTQIRTKMFGFVWHVDHIIPLQGKIVSGFHVPTNLRVIPGVDNVRKANRYSPA